MFLFSHFNSKTHLYFGVDFRCCCCCLSKTFGRCNPSDTNRMATYSVNVSLPNISIPIHLFEFEQFFSFCSFFSRSSSRITRFCYSPNRVCGRWANAVQTISNTIHWLMKRHSIDSKTDITNKVFFHLLNLFVDVHLTFARVAPDRFILRMRVFSVHCFGCPTVTINANCTNDRRDESNNV